MEAPCYTAVKPTAGEPQRLIVLPEVLYLK